MIQKASSRERPGEPTPARTPTMMPFSHNDRPIEVPTADIKVANRGWQTQEEAGNKQARSRRKLLSDYAEIHLLCCFLFFYALH